MPYNFKAVEKKWQKKWEEKKVFQAKEDKKRKKYYVLEMYPYPSGKPHMGHAFNYTIGDILARFKRMNGMNVLHPMGYDSFGLPAENAAIKAKSHPKLFTEDAIKNFNSQLKKLGFSYDWSRMVETHKPDYYKWDQWIFLKMYEKGLAFKKKASVNWCPKCNTVLANEQVHNGKCWRHGDTDVELKHLEQWFFRITDYADELYEGIDKLENWPEDVKAMQKNWIGKSPGAEIVFEINGEKWPIFTTRPDTIFGVTFMVVSAQHPRLMELVTKEQKKEIEKFLKKIKSTKQEDMDLLEKEGVFTGSYAINPINNDRVPVYAGNFVIADYGSGMVMAVPAHDQRDFDFAKKYEIPIRVVVKPGKEEIEGIVMDEAYENYGMLVNSGDFNGLHSDEAKEHIIRVLERKKLGKKTVQYKLRDWLISRQRFWGTPIPIIYCEKCGTVPVKEKDLPVKLPDNIKFKSEKNPLIDNKKFVDVKCPICGGKGRRETDTMDTFVNSSWYFLRYCDPKNSKKIFDKKKAEYWMEIDKYIGGKEHACMHLIYFRFYTKFLRDLKLHDFDEPTMNYFAQGMVHGSDGFVMSKSKGNGIDPMEIIDKYGADTLRFYLVSTASPENDFSWDDKGILGSFKFIKKIYDYYSSAKIGKSDARTESKLNQTIKDITEKISGMKYNLAVISLRNLFEFLPEETSKEVLEKSLKLLHPFCPHITEELWEKIKGKGLISLTEWPKADEKKIDKKFEEQEKAVENLIRDIINVSNILKSKGKKAERLYVYTLPNELGTYSESAESIEKRTNMKTRIYSVSDKEKHDPENKSKKVKPGKPGIYIE